MKKPETKNILVSVPVPMLKKLDASARKQDRSRTAMVRILLDQALSVQKGVKATGDRAAA